jgi:hypothetical protein
LNWIRIALIGGIAVSIFALGYMYSNQKHAEHAADVQKLITMAVIAKENELKAQHAARVQEETSARLQLSTDLEELQAHRDSLIEAIRNTQLTKPVAEVRVESCLESDDENIQVVVANPFSADFVRLWNDGSHGRVSGADPGPEAD